MNRGKRKRMNSGKKRKECIEERERMNRGKRKKE